MKLLKRWRARPFLEQLEDRCTPTYSGTISTVGGTLTMNGSTNTGTFTITQTGVNQFNVQDGNGVAPNLNLTVGGVTGLNITVNSTVADGTGFTPSLALNGAFGNVLGNVTLNFARAFVTPANVLTSTVNLAVTHTGVASSVLGTNRFTTTSAGDSTVTMNPATSLTLNNLSLTFNGGLPTANEVANIGSTAGVVAPITLLGTLTVTNVNNLSLGTRRVVNVNGSATITARTASTSATTTNIVSIGDSIVGATDTDTITGSVSVTTGVGFYNVDVQDVNILQNLSVTLNSATSNSTRIATANDVFVGGSIILNGGSAASNIVTVGNVGTSTLFASGSIFSYTAGNGNSILNLNSISASNTRLIVSVGNGTNAVNFDAAGNVLFSMGTLVGGSGSSTYTGMVLFPITVFNFS